MGSQLRLDGSEEHEADASLDQWFTPPDIARRMVAEAARWCMFPPRVLEPSSGAGAISKCLFWRFPLAQLTRYEIDPALCARTGATQADFLKVDGSLQWDLCVMNPPYSDGRDGEFLAKAVEQCEVVVALIRTHALHGVDRHAAGVSRRAAEHRKERALTAFAKGALVVAAIALAPATARADDAVWLARVAVAESGWSAPRDRAAIWHLLARRAERLGWTLPAMVRAYSSPLRRGHWALGLGANGRRPDGFPGRLSWAAHRGAWEAVLGDARAFLAGGIGDPCRGEAEHFGDRAGDAERARAAGWRRVDCGNTANLFWKADFRKKHGRAR